jgi:transcriptional repressor NF-X1
MKKACTHQCRERCHAPSACPEEKPCAEKIIITCPCQHLKQTLPCIATRSSKGNLEKALKCTEACKEIARKHQVADAFGINMETHTDGHIPYSSTTIAMYTANTTWAATQEKLLRGFAANTDERRYRFKPMATTRRAFIHSLAEDFALDSESMDPEPHRHVAVFKTPRFVSAPLKTLKECVSIKEGAEKAARREAMTAYQEREDAKRFNAFILSLPRFGITVSEIQSDLSPALDWTRGLHWEIEFLPTEEVVLRPSPSLPGTSITDANLESTLRSIKAQLVSLVSVKNTAASIQLARVDGSMAVLLRELESSQAGWSTVAAKGAAKTRAPERSGFGGSNVFTVLGRKKLENSVLASAPIEKPKKRKESVVVEDWEEAVRLDEEAENKTANPVEDKFEDHQETDTEPRFAEDSVVIVL